ncbi:MAG: hypothetical protein V1791_15765, partial [Pseudomonadota bacterium]
MNFTTIWYSMRTLGIGLALGAFTVASAGIARATDAAQVAGDLQVDGLWFSGDSNKTVIRKPSDFPAPWTITDTDIYFTRGNVGIGTPTPTALLDVNGTAKAAAFVGPSIGTMDNFPFEIMVNGSRAVRITPTTSGKPNIALGGPENTAGGADVEGA